MRQDHVDLGGSHAIESGLSWTLLLRLLGPEILLGFLAWLELVCLSAPEKACSKALFPLLEVVMDGVEAVMDGAVLLELESSDSQLQEEEASVAEDEIEGTMLAILEAWNRPRHRMTGCKICLVTTPQAGLGY